MSTYECEICGAKFCNNVQCKMLIKQKSTMSSFSYKTHFGQLEGELRENHARLEEQKVALREEKLRKFLNKCEDLFEDALSKIEGASVTDTSLVTIPTGLPEMAPIDDSLYSNYVSHLKDILDTAFSKSILEIIEEPQNAVSSSSFDDQDWLNDILEKLCTTCKGGCCRSGSHKAYLNEGSINRIRMHNQMITKKGVTGLLYFSYQSRSYSRGMYKSDQYWLLAA